MSVRDVVQAAAGALGGAEEGPLYVNDVFSSHLYVGNNTFQSIDNGIKLSDTNVGGSVNFGFDNISSYLTVPFSTDFNLGTGDFTLEAWIRTKVKVNYQCIFSSWDGTGYGLHTTADGFFMAFTNGTTIYYSTTDVCDGDWHHVACTRQSGTLRLFVDGVQEVSSSDSINASSTSSPLYIGELPGYDRKFSGYISNVRIVKGTALYTSNFTPSTTGLAEVSGTSIICCQGEDPLVDTSSNGRTISRTGITKPTAFGPFTSDVAGKGGLVWIKQRGNSAIDPSHKLVDSERGLNYGYLSTDTNLTSSTTGMDVTFNANGFSVGSEARFNGTSEPFASWTFRKAPKFFDIVTYTGTNAPQTIPHNLGSVPGFMIVKKYDSSGNWLVYHRSKAASDYILLDSGAATASNTDVWNNTAPTSTDFTVGVDLSVINDNYVVYLFAHDAGGFGLNGDQSIIKCGTYTGNGSSAGPVVNLGWEPQWLLIKDTTSANTNWRMYDNIRGFNITVDSYLLANSLDPEAGATNVRPTSTGFEIQTDEVTTPEINSNGNSYIYVAIRRGPFEIPTNASKVFEATTYTATNTDNRYVFTRITPDTVWARNRETTSAGGFYIADRLRSSTSVPSATTTVAASSDGDSYDQVPAGLGNCFSMMDGFGVGNDLTRKLNYSTYAEIAYSFKRAPGFYDTVVYTGNGSTNAVYHSLEATPELILTKDINTAGNTYVFTSFGASSCSKLDFQDSSQTLLPYGTQETIWAVPNSEYVYLGAGADANQNGTNYVMRMFASCPGVSKIGTVSFSVGSAVDVDCGFSNGARFVILKQLDGSGDWLVFDTARGIVSGYDPYITLNLTVQENANGAFDNIDPYPAGFTIPAGWSWGGGNWLYLAIA